MTGTSQRTLQSPQMTTIRPAAPEDAPAVASLVRELGYPADPAPIRERIESLRKNGDARLLVAIHDGMRCEALRSVSTVHFARLDEVTIRQYLSCGESLDKAGGYAVQGRAAVLIERIEGSYSGIMGLPLFETAQLLTEFGIAVLR